MGSQLPGLPDPAKHSRGSAQGPTGRTRTRCQATPSRGPDLGALAPPQAGRTKRRTSGRAAPPPEPAAPARAQPGAREGAASPLRPAPTRGRPPARTHRAATAAAAAAAWASVTSARRPGAGSAVGLGERRAPQRSAPMRGLSLEVPGRRRRLPGPRFQSPCFAWPASPQPALPADAAQPTSHRPHFRLVRAAARARWHVTGRLRSD